jgi:hypothetical protein
LGAGAAAGSISIQTINAQRGKEIKFNVVLEVVQSECAAGDGQFLCAAVITANTAVVTIEPVTIEQRHAVTGCGVPERSATTVMR